MQEKKEKQVIHMANELVKYDPELNTIPLRKFTAVEMNLFFSIVSRLRDQGDNTVKLTFNQLKDLSAYPSNSNKRFIDDLEKTYNHLMDLRFGATSKNGKRRSRFVMFTDFLIDGQPDNGEAPYVKVRVNSTAIPLLNNLEQWVRYSLDDFKYLRSNYAKTMFRLLKQFRTTGRANFKAEDLYELLDVPKSYLRNKGRLNQAVFNPIMEELTPIFRGLKLKKVYGTGRGRPLIRYEFQWVPERKDADDVKRNRIELEKERLSNVNNNPNLTDVQRDRAQDRIKGKKLGTHTNERLEKELQELTAERERIAKEIKNLEHKAMILSLTDEDIKNRSELEKRLVEIELQLFSEQ